MSHGHAHVLSRQFERVSPWVQLVAKAVEFHPGQQPQIYHSLAQADYVTVLAQTSNGLYPLVRQYRPAVEDWTLEFPSGLLEAGEAPEECCRRELLEEAGVEVQRLRSLGAYHPDTGRLTNRLHVFLAQTSPPLPSFQAEPGIEVLFVPFAELRGLIASGKLSHQINIGVITTALMCSTLTDEVLEPAMWSCMERRPK